MPIYTRTGDDGTTSTFKGKRILKSSPQIIANGNIDELNSFIGLFVSSIRNKEDIIFFTDIQRDLYLMMAYLSGSKTHISVLEKKIIKFEQKIDFIQSKLPELHGFILPQGTKNSSLLNVVRAVCRRAERSIVILFSNENVAINNGHSVIVKYLNRLSDLFFTLARYYNKKDVLA